MNPEEVLRAFERHGVMQTGHFQLSSGRHSDVYLQKQRVFEYPRLTARLADAIVTRFDPGSFTTVASPAVGAILLGGLVAQVADTRFVFAERVDGALTLRRGQTMGPEDRVLVVEDIVTTGGSVAEVIALCEFWGADVVGAAALADRTMTPPAFALTALLRVEARDWDPARCPLCAAGEPLASPGSRFLTGTA